MRIPKTSRLRVGMLLCLAVASSCSLSSSKDDPALHVDLSSYKDQSGRFALLDGGSLIQGLAPPQTATGFQCYGVNVTGPGIADSSIHPEPNPMLTFQKTLAGDYCTYRGVVTPPVYLNAGNADVALQVPPGGVRLVQVFGVNDPVICTNGSFGNDGGSGTNTSSSGSGGGKYFELGRGVVADLFSDRSVEITTTWPTTAGIQGDINRAARTLDCGGNCIHPIDSPASGLANYTSSLTIMSSSGMIRIGQKFTVPGATYLRRADVALSVATAGSVVTAAVYESPNALLTSAEVAAGPIATATATTTANSNTPAMVNFDFFDPVYFYRALTPGVNYFIVFSVSTGTATFKASPSSGTVGVVGSVSTFTNGDTDFVVESGGAREIFMKINSCN